MSAFFSMRQYIQGIMPWLRSTVMLFLYPLNRGYFMVTFISSHISSRGKRYQPKAEIYLYIEKKNRHFKDLSIFLFPLCKQFHIAYRLRARKNAPLTSSVLSSHYLDHIFVSLCTCYFHEVLVQTMSKFPQIASKESTTSIILICDVDVSMTFHGTWALILALIRISVRISTRISARKLKFSPKRRFARFTINRNTRHIVTYPANITVDYW